MKRTTTYRPELCLGYNPLRQPPQDAEHGNFLPLDSGTRVIEDAIAVVISLGKQSLWVDQYCVNQLDMNIKTSQTREMDRINAGAYSSFVARAGADADYGLPGFSRERKLRLLVILPDFEVFSFLTSTVCYNLQHQVEDSWLEIPIGSSISPIFLFHSPASLLCMLKHELL